jgi:hypothetical protein
MNLIKLILVVLFCGQVSLVQAQLQSVDELIVKSGVQRQVEQVPEVMKASFEQRFKQDQKMSAADRYNLRTAASESFQPAAMIKTVREIVAAGLSEAELVEIMKWLNSPLGMKITQLEEQSSSGDAYREMMIFAENMPEPAPARLALIERMDSAAHMTQYSTQLKVDVAMAMTASLACTQECNDFSREQLAKQLEKSRPQIEEASRQETIVHSLFSYQTLTDEELAEYIKFYETAAGQKYMRVVTSALSKAIQDASTIMGQKMGQALKEKKKISAQDIPEVK